MCKLSVLERIERSVLKGFGHVERMREERLVKRVYVAGNAEKETAEKMEG